MYLTLGTIIINWYLFFPRMHYFVDSLSTTYLSVGDNANKINSLRLLKSDHELTLDPAMTNIIRMYLIFIEVGI